MNLKWIVRTAAIVLTLAMTGCQASPAASAPQRQVVDPLSANSSAVYAQEYPGISDLVVLPGEGMTVAQTASSKAPSEVRAVWISYLEMADILKNKSAKQFTNNVAAVFDNVKSFGLNTVIVQVRPFGDALYDSDYFPWSSTITGTEGQDPGFDPLQIMVDEAKQRNLRIEAWVNPYRVRAAGNTSPLSADNQAKIWKDAKNSAVITYNGVTSYNPASKNARELIVNGVVEIVQKYEVDGIHIDDYFYPSTDADFDKSSYAAYKDGGGKLALADWRRANVETLLKSMYKSIKAENKNALFGISPQSSVDNNLNAQFLDVKKIAGSSGYCDYICPQIYFGYDNAAQPYEETLGQWSDMVKNSKVKLYVGLASYKVGAVDSYAGAGKNEWLQNTDLQQRMVADARNSSNYGGFVLYRYDYVFNPPSNIKSAVQKENKNLKSIF